MSLYCRILETSLRRVAVLLSSTLLAMSASAAGEVMGPGPIKVIVPFTAGSGADVALRIVTDELQSVLGTPVVVDNRPGARGAIGSVAVARSAPDGKTLVMSVGATMAAYPALVKEPAYDPIKDFTHVARLVSSPFILVTGPAVKSTTVATLVKDARANPKKVAYGFGTTTTQVAAHTFAKMANFNALPVGYKSQPPALTDLIGGQFHFMFADFALLKPHIKSGRVKALAVSTAGRSSVAPELPSLDELGFKGYDISTWIGLSAPAKTPPAIVAQLNTAINKALANKEVKARLEALGLDVTPQTPEQFTTYVKDQLALWTLRIHEAGLQPQ